MEAPTTSGVSAATDRGAGRGGVRSRGGDRGGDRGRGRGRGAARGGHDTVGERGRGGRGGHRGGRGRGFAPRSAVRHRSAAGKRGSHTPRDGEPAAKRERKDQKPSSNFALLHSMLGDAATIAEYVREYHSSDKFREARSVNTFLQAVSQRPDAVYVELMSQFKDEVFTTLERLFALYALGKNPMIPPAHEFLIRCEQEGVRKSAWAEGVRTLPPKEPEAEAAADAVDGVVDGVAPSPRLPVRAAPSLDAEAAALLSPRELLKKLTALDPIGRLQRQIELAGTVADLQVCANKLAAVVSEGSSALSSTTAEKFDYAAKCQLIGKLLSKARRLVEPAFAPPPPPEPSPTSVEEDVGSPEEGDAAAATAAAPAQRRDPLTADEVALFQDTASTAFHALETVLEQRHATATQQPLSKFVKVLEWCREKGLLAAADGRFAAVLEQQTEQDMAEQASQLETVIDLKSLAAGDTTALRVVVDRLWEAGHGKCFSPSSVDVLSAVAVAASAAGVDADVKRLVADRLVQTQRHLADTAVLPRRALRFVNDERNKVKQAAIAKQLEEEEACRHKAGQDE
ncbi:hypothetical protein NESM_000115200 [Novymonas esmeraldas]|uniref:Uncharacterized protein n=1 Tax=Novymonas esmeraldas TaxID=1808958 RepID=A0AAW0F2Z8_9TRYP